MSTQITTAFKKRYEDTVTLLLQQKPSRLRTAVMESVVDGQYQFFDRIGSVAMSALTSRHSATTYTNTPHDRRRLDLAEYTVADRIDWQDVIRTGMNPTNPYVQNIVAAMNRQIDDVIIAAFYGDASTGVDGAGTASFAAGNIIDENSEGMTINKLIETRKILAEGEVDLENDELFLAVSARQIDDLLRTTQVTSADYNSVKALVRGEIDTFLGFNIIRTERLPTQLHGGGAGAEERRCFAWAKSGMKLGMGRAPKINIDVLPDYNYTTQVYGSLSIGSVRMEEEKVVEIECDNG